MFAKLIRRIVLAAAILVPVSVATAPAQADGRFGFSVTVNENGVRLSRGGNRDFGRQHRQARRDVCRQGQALRKAHRLGVRNARIVRDNRRAVVVSGRGHRGEARVRFAQARGCPVIAYRR